MKEIPLTKGYIAFVDDEDYEWLSKYSWHYNNGYGATKIPISKGKYKTVHMHRMIMNPPDDKQVDHINGEKNDNRRVNLRIVTPKENKWNSKMNYSSKFKGVSEYNSGKYEARIKYNNKNERLGTFTKEIAAVNAYNYYANLYFGEYARLNDVEFMDKNEWEKYKIKFSSSYIGVYWSKDNGKWVVQIKVDDKRKKAGYFIDEITAANYYNHLVGKEINKCEYVSLDECERRKSRKHQTRRETR